MKTVVLTISPQKQIRPLIEALLEAGIAVAPDRPGEIIVESDRADTVEKFFRVYGFETKREGRFLEGAMDCLAEFVRFEDDGKATKKPETQVGRQKLVTFIQRRIREARKGRNKRRAQHVRDELSGKIRAYEDILRRLKKS